MLKQILFAILLICSLNFLICHEDEDTEFINTSFLYQILKLHVPREKCKIRVISFPVWYATGSNACKDGNWEMCTFADWVLPTNKFDTPKEMPTCLKDFYEIAYVPVCGKPMYNKFKHCAKALHHYQKKKYPNSILVLFDGCVWCPQWSERSTNVQIELGVKTNSESVKHFNKAITTTASDRYADFKIGAIFHLFDEKRWQFEYYLKITHRCNQYNMVQEKILEFAHYVHKIPEKIIEHTNFEIKLPQGSGKRKKITVLN